jgi:hypothetical protein
MLPFENRMVPIKILENRVAPKAWLLNGRQRGRCIHRLEIVPKSRAFGASETQDRPSEHSATAAPGAPVGVNEAS